MFGAALLGLACGGGSARTPTPPPPKRFPVPIFDGLALGMARGEVARVHPIRSSVTAAGRNRRIWIYDKPGDYTADLIFPDGGEDAKLLRIDVHFGPRGTTPDEFIARFEATLGPPEARRRKADINAYGDPGHDQYETIWSDASQYVFLTERVPAGGRPGPTAYFLSVKRKEITATGPPTGYVPPPPPKGKDGKPVEESPF